MSVNNAAHCPFVGVLGHVVAVVVVDRTLVLVVLAIAGGFVFVEVVVDSAEEAEKVPVVPTVVVADLVGVAAIVLTVLVLAIFTKLSVAVWKTSALPKTGYASGGRF